MKRLNLLLLASLLFPVGVYAQPDSTNLDNAILKTQSKIDIGITYYEYRGELQNINFEMHRYQNAFKKWAKDNSIDKNIKDDQLKKVIDYMYILENHKCVLTLWSYKISSKSEWIKEELAFVDSLKEMLGERFQEFEIEKHTKRKGNQKYVETDIIMQMFWWKIGDMMKENMKG